MSKRRAHVTQKKGHGSHAGQTVDPGKRPSGNIRPVVSSTRHGRPVDREVSDGCAGGVVGIIIAAIIFLTL